MQYLRRGILIFVATLAAWTAEAQGVLWEPTAIDTSLHVRTLFVGSDATVLAGTDAGLLRSTDVDEHWSVVGPVGVNDVVELSSGVLVAAGREGGHRSEDGGESWEEVLPKPLLDECGDILQYTYAALSPIGTVLVGSIEEDGGSGGCKISSHLYESNDGAAWSSIPAHFFDAQAILPIAPDTLIYGSDGGGITLYFNIHTEDEISRRFITELGGSVTELVADHEGILFAASGRSFQGIGEGRGIFRSSDRGETWQQVNNGLTDTTVTDLAVYEGSTLLAATYRGGVHRSVDGGNTWQALNTGLSSSRVTALAITPDGMVYAGTDEGIYRSTRPIATGMEDEPELPEHFYLGANYPNPFNPQTTIPLELAASGPVRLSVYNALGQEVAVLVDGTMDAGAHRVTFRAREIPSGTYLYRIRAGTFTDTGLMTFLK